MADFFLMMYAGPTNFTFNCKLTLIFDCNTHISNSNQHLMDRTKSCYIFSPSFSIICYSPMYVTQYRRKDLLLLPFHHEFKGISVISRKNNLIDSWKVAVLIRQLPKHPKNCAGAEIRNSEQQLSTQNSELSNSIEACWQYTLTVSFSLFFFAFTKKKKEKKILRDSAVWLTRTPLIIS